MFRFVHRKKKSIVKSTSVGSYLIIFPKANRVDPDQAALTRAALSGPALLQSVERGLYDVKG